MTLHPQLLIPIPEETLELADSGFDYFVLSEFCDPSFPASRLGMPTRGSAFSTCKRLSCHSSSVSLVIGSHATATVGWVKGTPCPSQI